MTKPGRALAPMLILGVFLSLPAHGEEPAARGKTVFNLWCAACHKRLDPKDLPVAGTSSLARKYGDKKPAALEDRRDLAPGYVRGIVRHGVKSMPASRKTEISDADLDALVQYLTQPNS